MTSVSPVAISMRTICVSGLRWKYSRKREYEKEIEGLSSQMDHAHLERDPGAERGFLEDHAQGLAFEQWGVAPGFPLLFDLDRQLEQAAQVVGRQIDYAEIVFHGTSTGMKYGDSIPQAAPE